MKSYQELEVWKEARVLVKDIYLLTIKLPSEEKFGLISQLRRAAVSVPANIAEGIGRNHSKDTLQFLFIARGSLNELETLLILSLDLDFISQESIQEIMERLIRTRKLLIGFINYKSEKSLSN